MGKAIHRFKTVNNWERFIKGGAVHLNKIAELYLPKQTPIVCVLPDVQRINCKCFPVEKSYFAVSFNQPYREMS